MKVEINIHNIGQLFEGMTEPQLCVRLNKEKKECGQFEQDEIIFGLSHLNTKTWYVNDQCKLQSKEMGRGIMVSRFSSYKFGFGMDISKDELQQLNTYRNNKRYSGEEDAFFLNGTATK